MFYDPHSRSRYLSLKLCFAASSIHKKLGIEVVSDSTSLDLYRGIRSQIATLLDGLDPTDMATMSLGLSHSLSRSVLVFTSSVTCGSVSKFNDRFKLKFSPDKVDTMVVQAIALLDDLDKEINIYSMRVKVSFTSGIFSLILTILVSLSKGMVRVALPRNGQNYRRQHCIRQSRKNNGYVVRLTVKRFLILIFAHQASGQTRLPLHSPRFYPKISKLHLKLPPRSAWVAKFLTKT